MTIYNVGRITILKDVAAKVEDESGALGEIFFGVDTDTGKLGFTADLGGTWTWITSGGGVVTGSHTIMDEGSTLPHRPVLNFVGNSIWALDNSGQGRTDIIVSGTSSGGGHTIENEGSPLTQRAKLNFVGASVDVTDDAGDDRTIVTISNITGSSSGDVIQDGAVSVGNLAVFSADHHIEDGGPVPTGTTSGSGIPIDGWIAADAMTYASADDPTYTLTVSGDKSGTYQAGQRVKLTQATGGTKYFIITKVAVSGDTTLTLYGGTDYNLENEAISNPYYSVVKAPFGFPLDPTKWTVRITDTTNRSQSDPASGTWYNLGTMQISIPVGCWNVRYQVVGYFSDANNNGWDECEFYITLSTGNNSESDTEFTAFIKQRANSGNNSEDAVLVTRWKVLSLSSKTTYYLNMKNTGVASGTCSIAFQNGASPLILETVCAYL